MSARVPPHVAKPDNREPGSGGTLPPPALGGGCAAAPRRTAPGSSLRRNFSWAVLGDVLYAGCQWGMVVALAKLGTPELLGQFSLGLALTAPVFMLATLQLRALQATAGSEQGAFAPFLTLRLLLSGLACFAILSLLAWADYSTAAKAVASGVALFKGVELVSDIFHGELQRRAEMKWVGISVMLKGLLGLLVLTAGLWFGWPLAWLCLLIAGTWLLILLGVDARQVALRTPLRLCRQRGPLTRLLVQALPLGVVAMLISLTLSVPRYFLEHHAGDAVLGIYAALAALMQASTLPAAALGSAASGRLGSAWAAGDAAAVRRLLGLLVGLAALGGLGSFAAVWLIGPLLLRLFYAPEYAAYHDDFCLLMLTAIGSNICFILNWAVVAGRYLLVQIPLHLALLGVTTAACGLLVPAHGLRGAVWGIAVSTGCAVLGTGVLVAHALGRLASVQSLHHVSEG